jgi:hypothetical protein
MNDFLSWLGPPRALSRRSHAEEKGGENIVQGKTLEVVTEKAKQAN